MGAKERLGRGLLFAVRPAGDRRRDARGRCSVCGGQGRFVFNSWILPDEMKRDLGDAGLIEAFAARESLFCRYCGSSLRVRRLVDVLLGHYAERAETLSELVEEDGFRALRIAEVNSVGSVHPILARLPGLAYSEYRPGEPLGVEVGGIRNEDVGRLSYADGSFDLVLTSDTLEHVPDYPRALAESRRVLPPGGRHVFTVPLVPGRERTVARASAGPDGQPVHHVAPQHHGRGSGPFALVSRQADLLVYTDFGLDLLDELRAAGFDPELHGEGDVAAVFCARAA